MRQEIFEFSNSNMAGSSWVWTFYLEDEGEGTYKLDSENFAYGDEIFTIEPVSGIRRGADLYASLLDMLCEAGYGDDELELPSIAAEISRLNPTLGDQFQRGPSLLERREKYEENKAESILDPYREIIDEYVKRISGEPRRYGTRRMWVKKFMEQYVVSHGHLPQGIHSISVDSNGSHYSGGPHDFSDLRATEEPP